MSKNGLSNGYFYERTLVEIAKLNSGRIEGQGSLDGLANSCYWNNFESNLKKDTQCEFKLKLMKGIVAGLDQLRIKMDSIEKRLTKLEKK